MRTRGRLLMARSGKAVWKGQSVVRAGESSWHEVEFEVGAGGIKKGGGLRIYPYLTTHEWTPWTLIRWTIYAVRAFGPQGTRVASSIVEPGGHSLRRW